MKKFASLILLSSFLTLGAVPTISSQNVMADEQKIEYVDIGPGIYNSNQTHTPIESFNSGKYSIAFRNNALMVFPNKNMYESISFNTSVNDNELIDTDFSKIRIYTSEKTYKTIDKYLISYSPVKYNIYADAAQNFAFFFEPDSLKPKDIYKICFEEGFVLPYPDANHSTKYILKETINFLYNSYGSEEAGDDIFFADEWMKQTTTYDGGEETPVDEGGIQVVPAAVFTQDPNYRMHIRGSNVTEQDHIDGKLDEDDFSCRLFIFFGEGQYNPEISNMFNINIDSSKFDLSDSETSYIKNLYEKVTFVTDDDEVLTLKDVANPFTKGLPQYNTFGERYCLSFKIGNEFAPTDRSFNGRSFKTITVHRGAQFPSYAYTHLGSRTEYRYEQIDDITLTISTFKQALWVTYAEYAFNAADIDVTSLNARHVNVNTNDLKLDATVIDIGLSECNYEGQINKEIITVGENLTRYVYVNGRAIYYAYDQTKISAYANLDGKTDTISIVIPENVNDIKEIIVQRGCSIPSLVASKAIMEIYGGYVSYYVLSSESYDRADGSSTFNRSSKIYWTLWFDGKKPMRVQNATTFDFSENAPEGDSDETKRFVKWQDENGNDVTGYIRINSGREYFGVYTFIYKVEFKNIDKETSIRVDRYTRLTSVEEIQNLIIPLRNGYKFQGWVDEDGNHYNMNNRVTRDMTLTATWIETTSSTTKTSANVPLILTIVIGSVAAFLVAADITLIIMRKRKSS